MSARGPRRGIWALLVAFAAPLAASAAGSPAASPAASDGLDALMHELAAHPPGHVSFTEVQHLAVLDRPLESSGELLYQAPDRLEKRILKPRPETLVLAHGVLSATRGKHTRSMELAAWPQIAPLLESLRATLTGDRATLERIFSVELEGDAARWTLSLTPKDPEAARAVTRVIITGENAKLRTVETFQADGDRSLLTIGAELAP